MVTGVEEAEDEREEGHTRPTRLFRRSRHVNGLGRRRSGGDAGSGIGVGAGGVEVGLEVERRIDSHTQTHTHETRAHGGMDQSLVGRENSKTNNGR